MTADDFLNMRQGPAVTYPVVQRLQGGVDGVTLIGEPVTNGSTRWQQISSRGVVGWVNADYLSFSNSAQTNQPSVTPNAADGAAGNTRLWLGDYGGRVNWEGRAIQLRGEKASVVQAKISEVDPLAASISRTQKALHENEAQVKKAGPFAKKSLVKRINEIPSAIEGMKKQKATATEQVEKLLRTYAIKDDTAR
jgi:uncharacterized protein YgiM (DUF1202 family)